MDIMTPLQTAILCDLYLRLSDGRHENGSFVEREKALRGKASGLGWHVRNVVIENDLTPGGAKSASAFKRRKITLPDGSTAMRVVRPGFRGILDDLAAGRIGGLLAEDLDRVLRDPRDGEDLIDVVQAARSNVDSLSGSLKFTNGGTDAEITQARVLVAFAWKSSRDTVRRVSGGRSRVAGAAQWGGGRRPYGFRPEARPSGYHRNTVLVMDPAEAKVIRECADAVLSETYGQPGGNSLASIAKGLRDKGVPTVTGAKWSAETLKDVLCKPTNAGIVVHDGQETEVRLPGEPILTEDVYRAVVAKLRDPSRSTPGRAPCWLGSNIYRCVCGYVMVMQGGKGRKPSYKCGRPTDERTPDQVHTRRNAIHVDAWVSTVVVARLEQADVADLFAPSSPTIDVKALRAKALAKRERLNELSRDYADDLIDREQYLSGTRRGRDELAKVEAQLASVTARSPLAPIIGAENVAETWASLPLGTRRAIVSEVCTVTILPTSRKGAGFDPDAVRIEPK